MAGISVITTVRDRIQHLTAMRTGLAAQRLLPRSEALEHVIVRMGGADPWRNLAAGPPVVQVEMVLPPGEDRARLP